MTYLFIELSLILAHILCSGIFVNIKLQNDSTGSKDITVLDNQPNR